MIRLPLIDPLENSGDVAMVGEVVKRPVRRALDRYRRRELTLRHFLKTTVRVRRFNRNTGLRRTAWSIVDTETARTLAATTFGKWGPELAGQVGSGRLVLAGVSTDCCVLSTAVAAADAGVGGQVVADACAGASDESHSQTLDILRLYDPLIEVVTVADIIGP